MLQALSESPDHQGLGSLTPWESFSPSSRSTHPCGHLWGLSASHGSHIPGRRPSRPMYGVLRSYVLR